MGAGLLSGFERGFNMMERHKSRVGRDERTARIDEQNESRYQDSQARLADMDNQNKNHYQDGLTRQKNLDEIAANQYSDEQARQKTMDNSNLAANNSRIGLNEFKLKKAQKDDNRVTDQGSAQRAWEYASKNNGKLDPSLKATDEDNAWFFPGYEFEKGFSETADKFLSTINDARDKGDFSLINTPENMARLKTVLPEMFKVQEGERDEKTGLLITKKDPAGIIPVKGEGEGKSGITFGLTVTYEDGSTQVKPRSNFGSSAEEDGPRVYDLKGMMGEFMTRKRLAEFQENPEKFQERMNSTINNTNRQFGPDGNKANYNKDKAYREGLATIEKDKTNAIAKIQGDSEYNMDEEKRTEAIKRVTALFGDRISSLNQSYGINTKSKDNPINSDPFGLFSGEVEKPKGGGTTDQTLANPEKEIKKETINKATTVAKATEPEQPKENYDEWASPPQDFMDVSGLNAIGRGAKSAFNGVLSWEDKKRAESRFASRYGKAPNDEQLEIFLAQEQETKRQYDNK